MHTHLHAHRPHTGHTHTHAHAHRPHTTTHAFLNGVPQSVRAWTVWDRLRRAERCSGCHVRSVSAQVGSAAGGDDDVTQTN